MTNYNFSSKFKHANILSVTLFFISIILITFKGLNYGIDFKGGTLIELRSSNTEASSIRDVLKNMDLGDVNVKKFGKDEKDTGSSEVQVALLTERIRLLTEHAKKNKKDNHSRRGLVMLVSQRKKLLKYLRRINPESYLNVTQELSIRRN